MIAETQRTQEGGRTSILNERVRLLKERGRPRPLLLRNQGRPRTAALLERAYADPKEAGASPKGARASSPAFASKSKPAEDGRASNVGKCLAP